MPRANLFNPFSSLPPQHENRLTWAFLVTLKYAPLLQNFLRELVESKLPPEELRGHSNFWEPARVFTQTRSIDSSTSRLVSILLTDEKTVEDIQVEWSDREAVYDGVIEYHNGLTLIVENKLSQGNVWAKQLSPSRNSFEGDVLGVDLHASAICLEWSEVLEGVLQYANSGIASFSSREIAVNLLSFVEEYHPNLTPCRTFRLCGNRLQALNRRTVRLLDALASSAGLESREEWYLFRPGKIAERVGVWAETETTLKVNLWPANTIRQARRFFEEADRTTFLNLEEWEVRPDLHFSYINTTPLNAETTWAPAKYFDYFANGQSYGQMNQAMLVHLARQWESEELITHEDRRKIEDHFKSKRETLNVIPGFSVYRVWNLDTVIKLEEAGELEADVIEALATPLCTWGEKL